MAIQMRDPMRTTTRCSGCVEAGAVRLFQSGYLSKIRYGGDEAGHLSYTIPSESQAGVVYEIEWDVDADTLLCSCPAGQHNVPCKHIRLFQLSRGWAVQKAGA